jgi:hypothetical protein
MQRSLAFIPKVDVDRTFLLQRAFLNWTELEIFFFWRKQIPSYSKSEKDGTTFFKNQKDKYVLLACTELKGSIRLANRFLVIDVV